MFLLKGHQKAVQRLEFSADGATLLSVDASRNVRLWDLETRDTRWKLEGEFFASIAFTPDCGHVLTAIHRTPSSEIAGDLGRGFHRRDPLQLHDVESGNASPASIQYGPESGLNDLTFSPDGRRCAAQGDWLSSQLFWWEYPSGRPLPTWVFPPGSGGFLATAFSPDGRILAGMNARGVRLFDMASGDLGSMLSFDVRQGDCCLAFHPNNKHLALGSGPNTVVVDIESCEEVATLQLPKKFFLDAGFTRDGRFLATVSHEQTVKFWDTSSWRVAHEYAWEVGGLHCIAFDRDGCRAAAAGTGKKIVVWDLDD